MLVAQISLQERSRPDSCLIIKLAWVLLNNLGDERVNNACRRAGSPAPRRIRKSFDERSCMTLLKTCEPVIDTLARDEQTACNLINALVAACPQHSLGATESANVVGMKDEPLDGGTLFTTEFKLSHLPCSINCLSFWMTHCTCQRTFFLLLKSRESTDRHAASARTRLTWAA